MKKMPTLFVREFVKKGKKTIKINITEEVEKGCEWALSGKVIAYRKFDGTCCMIEERKLYKRFDYKEGRKLPEGAIPCQDKADEITGHFPHWVECKRDNTDDKYHFEAFDKLIETHNGTYELVGEKINKNKDKIVEKGHVLIPHVGILAFFGIFHNLTFDEIKHHLERNMIEGLILTGEERNQVCKIKRSDFGFEW